MMCFIDIHGSINRVIFMSFWSVISYSVRGGVYTSIVIFLNNSVTSDVLGMILHHKTHHRIIKHHKHIIKHHKHIIKYHKHIIKYHKSHHKIKK